MIDILHDYLTVPQRKEIFRRSILTNPFYYRMRYDIARASSQDIEYKARLGINRDFYLTEMLGNFSDIRYATASEFKVSIYTALLRSIYNYVASDKLMSSFLLQDARQNTPLPEEFYDDRQFEIPPVLIKKNDQVYAELQNLNPKSEATIGHIVLKGFNIVEEQPFISPRDTQLLNESFESPVRTEYFHFDVRHTGLQTYALSNDRFPRYVLGFGITNDSENKSEASNATVTIKDTARRLALTDTDIPIQFIAPRVACTQDTHIYYLPLEYFWQPFSTLEFNINNQPVPDGDEGFKLSILTATV